MAAAQAAVVQPPRPASGGNAGHVTVRSSSLAVGPERTASLTSAAAGGRQQEEDAKAGSNNSSQVYHMMSERKRREKLNDSFHTLRCLLPPCSKVCNYASILNPNRSSLHSLATLLLLTRAFNSGRKKLGLTDKTEILGISGFFIFLIYFFMKKYLKINFDR